jgi:hypothetical protein
LNFEQSNHLFQGGFGLRIDEIGVTAVFRHVHAAPVVERKRHRMNHQRFRDQFDGIARLDFKCLQRCFRRKRPNCPLRAALFTRRFQRTVPKPPSGNILACRQQFPDDKLFRNNVDSDLAFPDSRPSSQLKHIITMKDAFHWDERKRVQDGCKAGVGSLPSPITVNGRSPARPDH